MPVSTFRRPSSVFEQETAREKAGGDMHKSSDILGPESRSGASDGINANSRPTTPGSSGSEIALDETVWGIEAPQTTDQSITASPLENLEHELKLEPTKTVNIYAQPQLVAGATRHFHQRPPDLHSAIGQISTYTQYFSPILLLLFFLVASAVYTIKLSSRAAEDDKTQDSTGQLYGPGGKPLPSRKITGLKRKPAKPVEFSATKKLAFKYLSLLVTLTFLASVVSVALHVLMERGWWCGEAQVIYTVGSFFVYSVTFMSLLDTKPTPTTAHLYTWSLAIVLETVRLTSFAIVVRQTKSLEIWTTAELVINAVRLVALSMLALLYVVFRALLRQRSVRFQIEEAAPLLRNDRSNGHSANGGDYGTASTRSSAAPTRNNSVTRAGSPPSSRRPLDEHEHEFGDVDDTPGWSRPDKLPSRGWWEYVMSYAIFFPYLWPSNDRRLQLTVLTCFALVLMQRAVNVMVPIQIGVITDDLSGENGPVHIPWKGIMLYVLYRSLQGSNSFVGVLRTYLWIPVTQYTYRELSVASFEHVHNLSLNFHIGKKTGEVISALGKGNAINNFLDQITFQVVPMIVDLVVAIGYFLIVFDAYFALVVTVMTFWYIYFTIRLARWRADARRKMVNLERYQDGVKNDSMGAYETVKYFNAEAFEFDRYRNCVKNYQKAEYTMQLSLNIMNCAQMLIFLIGLVICCFIASYQITIDRMKVGKFISLLTYMAQLQAPLNYFGQFYRVIQTSMISAERLLELFRERPSVFDEPNAVPLVSTRGDIKFKNVMFAYENRKHALNCMDFHCKPGTITALVGESGGGKSTVFRLLFRFYVAQGGSIEVDGKNVRDITIDSLRRHIGVVPQDPILFNETIIYNLRYAKQGAKDEEIYEACRAASIHDRIMSFPDKYETRVGDRGMRLSGGEKQRVAIARTILKGSPIILLDEATAALDTETEQNIQRALRRLAQGRTMIVIAHRLSTIRMADQILVLHEGAVAERGTHAELRAKGARYERMWTKQSEAKDLDNEARLLRKQASRLRRESKGDTSLERMSSEGSNQNSDDDRATAAGASTAKGSSSRRT